MKIAFLWYCPDNADYERWSDGLWAALEIIKKDHEVQIFRRPDAPNIVAEINKFKPDVLLCWGAFSEWFWHTSIPYLDYPKVLCFAGGEPNHPNRDLFDKILVESDDWENILTEQGYEPIRAFGTNTKLYRPLKMEKKFLGIYPATFAAWKRHDLFAKALGDKGLAVGRKQPGIEEYTWKDCIEMGVEVRDVVHPEELVKLYNQSEFTVLTSTYWGGSQRQCLESMACNIPVICLDEGKCAEYVKESGFGMVVSIADLDNMEKVWSNAKKEYTGGREYILQNYSEEIYAKNILEAIESLHI